MLRTYNSTLLRRNITHLQISYYSSFTIIKGHRRRPSMRCLPGNFECCRPSCRSDIDHNKWLEGSRYRSNSPHLRRNTNRSSDIPPPDNEHNHIHFEPSGIAQYPRTHGISRFEHGTRGDSLDFLLPESTQERSWDLGRSHKRLRGFARRVCQ